jgi:putative Ca2+/H+ antiporter (TMEM165/GDT1 family)
MAGEAMRSSIAGRDPNMQSFLVSTGVVALAEMGDKTQILSLILAARYRKPVPIILGVLAATLANHAAAGGIGTWLANVLDPSILNWAVVASFILMAVWILVPDKFSEGQVTVPKRPMGVFATTVVAFFLAEMGDKTQVVTVALAARFHDFIGVVSGSTSGMMLANIPVIYLGHRFADRIPAKAVHALAAVIFLVLGGLALRNALVGA